MQFKNKIADTVISPGQVGLFYIAQAGFCIKTASGKTIFIDPYLSDACERMFGFKRMIPSPLQAEEVNADLYLITHHHADHLDPDALPVIVQKPDTFFGIAPDCVSFFEEMKVNPTRYKMLKEDDQWQWNDISIKAIYADHGELAPDAIGYLLEIDGIKIYHVGDTAYRPEEIKASLQSEIDIMIAPINGTYGNMIASEACELAALLKPRLLIPCHFWMFLEHVVPDGKGDPATFLQCAAALPGTIKAKVMAPGELLIYEQNA